MSKTIHPTSQDASAIALDAANNLIEQVTALVGPAPALTAAAVQRSVKLRKGGERVIPTITALSDQYGLALPATTTANILAKMKRAQDLVPLHKKLTTALKQVSDAMFSANSESWEGATMHYTVLTRLAKSNGDLHANLAPVRQFFAKRSSEVVALEKEAKATRTVAKASKAMAKANAKLAAIQGATAPVNPAGVVNAAVTAPAPSATPATPAPTRAPSA